MTRKRILKRDSFLSIDGLVLLSLFFSAYASMAIDSLNSIALYGALPVAFVLSLISSKTVFPNKYFTLLFLLFVWETLSLLWSYYPDLTKREIHSLLGVMMLSYIMSVQAMRPKMLAWLYLVFLLLYLGAWNYASSHLLIVSDFSASDRLNDEKLNANTMAYYTFYVTFAFFILDEIVSAVFWKKAFRLLFILMIPVSFFVAFATASRQVLLIQLPLMTLLLWLRYIRSANWKRKALFLLISTVVLIYFAPKLFSVYADSYLAERASMSVADDVRSALLRESIQIGLEHSPLGVGAGSYIMFSQNRHFSHNSFAELFANVGVIGLLLYSFLLFTFLIRQWKRYKGTKDIVYLYFLVFGVLFLVDQVFYVFYVDIWLFSFFILVSSHSELYYYSHHF